MLTLNGVWARGRPVAMRLRECFLGGSSPAWRQMRCMRDQLSSKPCRRKKMQMRR